MQDEQQHPSTGRPTPPGEPTPPSGAAPPPPKVVARESAAAPSSPKESTLPSLTQKQRRIGERIIEFGIFAIATTSIVTIFLIFIFIFKEAAPIFFGSSEEKKDTVAAAAPHSATTAATESESGLESEQYNPSASTDSDSSLESEQYNPAPPTDTAAGSGATASADEDEAELYNPDAKDIPSPGSSDSGSTAVAGNDSTPAVTPAVKPAEPAEPTTAEREAIARSIVGENYPILDHDSPVSFGYLFHDVWQPNSEHPRYGIYPIILGTLKTTLIALLIAAPLGVLAALYSAFFAPRWMRETLKPAIELLAGFPSVVLGFFCLMTVATVVQTLFGAEYRLNAVVGGIGLALAVIPIIYTISDDALRAVPGSLREAALALGASEWQVAYKIMLPAATPGIFAAILLGIGRAFGETMIALMATGNALTVDWNLFQSVRTFAATIGAEMGEVVFGSPHYQVLFLLGVILFIFSFLINFVTEFYVKKRLIRRFRGSE